MDKVQSHDIEVRLLGQPSVLLHGNKVTFPYQKVEALFYFLCANRQISRSQAIGILWADSSEATARKNLRDVVYNIRKVLGQDVLLMEGNTMLTLNRERDIHIDVEHIAKENLLELWHGEFLQYFYVKKCYEFETWAEGERAEKRRICLKLLRLRIMSQKPGQDLEFLEESGRLLIRSEDMDEEIYRSIMKKLAEAGRYSSAMELYQALRTFLIEGVDEEPGEETHNLYKKICDMRSKLKRTPKEEESFFFGRSDILYLIYSGICCTEEDREQKQSSYLIMGEPGVGKSTLLGQIRQMVQDADYLMFDWTCCETEKDLYLLPWHGIMGKVNEYCRNNGVEVESPVESLMAPNVTDVQLFMTRFEILTESVFRYLAKNFGDRKILLFIDDIQWMDSMSLRLMSNLLFRMGQGKLIAVTASGEYGSDELKSFRIPLVGRGILKEIELKPFGKSVVEEIVEVMGRNQGENRELAEKIYEKTQGNPLFVMETLRLWQAGADGSLFTDKMSNVIQSRLLGLSRREKTLLDIISVFSVPVTLEEINQILGMEDRVLQTMLDPLLDKKLIYEKLSGGKVYYGFLHQMIQEFVYRNLPESKCEIYHNYIAQYYEKKFEKGKDLEICSHLIYHYERCRDKYKFYSYKLEYLEKFYRVSYDDCFAPERKTVFRGNIEGYSAHEDELSELTEEIRRQAEENAQLLPVYMQAEYLLGRYEMFVKEYQKGREHIKRSLKLAKRVRDKDYILRNYLQLILYRHMTGQNKYIKKRLVSNFEKEELRK